MRSGATEGYRWGMDDLGAAPRYIGRDDRQRDAIGVFGITTTRAFDPSVNPNPNGNPAQPVIGRQQVTSSAVALPNEVLGNGVVVRSMDANSADIELLAPGQTAGDGYPLAPGDAVSFAITNLSAIRVVGSGGGWISWAGS